MENVEFKEIDGQHILQMEVTDEEYGSFLRAGFESMIEQEGLKLVVVDPKYTSSSILDNAKKIELSDEEAQYFLELGVNDILRKAIKKYESDTKV